MRQGAVWVGWMKGTGYIIVNAGVRIITISRKFIKLQKTISKQYKQICIDFSHEINEYLNGQSMKNHQWSSGLLHTHIEV